MKKAQISFEYLIIMGFITFTIFSILGVAIFYSNLTKQRIKDNQLAFCMDKIIATSESVFYSGFPSKAVIVCYLPDSLKQMNATTKEIIVRSSATGGEQLTGYRSNVKLLEKEIIYDGGMKKFKIEVLILPTTENVVNITWI